MDETEKKDVLLHNYLLDLRKKTLDDYDRAVMLSDYIKRRGISQRQLAREVGVPRSTIDDWLRWSRISKEEYEQNVKTENKTEAYRLLREHGAQLHEQEDTDIVYLDKALESMVEKLKPFIISPDCSDKTLDIIKDLRGVIDLLEKRIKGKMGGAKA